MDITKKVRKEVRKALKEGLSEPYNRQNDETLPDIEKTRQPKLLTLKMLVQLSKMRNERQEELAQNSVFIPYLYGPQPEQQQDQMVGGLGL